MRCATGSTCQRIITWSSYRQPIRVIIGSRGGTTEVIEAAEMQRIPVPAMDEVLAKYEEHMQYLAALRAWLNRN